MKKQEINYQIREARPGDASALVDLVSRGMIGYPFENVYDEESVRGSIQQPNDRRVVAEEDQTGRLIGTAVLGDRNDHMQEIKRVVVDPEVRKNGVATSMTKHLAQLARELRVVSWADARADQPGMQSAALRAGHRATSLETGKHCVYWHLDRNDEHQVGPARETMVHLTSLPVDITVLQRELIHWPEPLVSELLSSLSDALAPQEKDEAIVQRILPSAAEVKRRISENLRRANVEPTPGSDVVMVRVGDATMAVILPDASGFVVTPPNADLAKAVALGELIGLQTITTYVDVADLESIPKLQAAGLRPTMLRVWQEKESSRPRWQVGWRKVANHYDQSLHYLRLHADVEEQVTKVIARIS